nr:uncharacterized protein LOC121121603 [Lepeophtheirus salmonis]
MYSAFKLVPLLSSILVFVASSPKQKGFCWEPGSNPFIGQPKTERLDSDRVRINWSEIFNKNGNCKNVDFLIKSNPRHSPSDYKLSDFTQKGQTSATLMVTDGEDFVFQIIAREDKRPKYGIEYKYSQMVTSYFREDTAPDIGFKEVLTTEKLRVTKIKKSSLMTTTTPKYSRNAAKDKCVLPLKKFNSNNILSNKLLKEFIGYMNKNSVRYVHEFMRDKKACSEQSVGFIVSSPKTSTVKCCSSPWGGNCYIKFAECDGSCIPQDWISDNWPDCLDGSDEPELESLSGRSLSEELQCVSCGGNVIAAVSLCSDKNYIHLTNCVKELLGDGNCSLCISDYFE